MIVTQCDEGPFRGLHSQTIAVDVNGMHRQLVDLGVLFRDSLGAKRVVDTVRKRMEKFIGYLPLLHAVCNPGLRERHWITVCLKSSFVLVILKVTMFC